nr:hypothetical protein [Variovorax boronicumulans]
MPTTPAWPVSEHTGVPESGPYLTPTGPDTTGEVTAAEVPEPAGLALVMLAGLAALAGLRLGRLRTAHHSR